MAHSTHPRSYHRYFVHIGKKHSRGNIPWRTLEEREFWIHSRRVCEENMMWNFLCKAPSAKLSHLTCSPLHSQVTEGTCTRKADAKQFKNTIWNTLISINFVICFICSPTFCLIGFYLLVELKHSPGLRVGSLVLKHHWDRFGYGCRASFFTSDSLSVHHKHSGASPPCRAAASMITWAGSARQPTARTFYHLLHFFKMK